MSSSNQILLSIEKLLETIKTSCLEKIFSALGTSPHITLLGKNIEFESIKNPLHNLEEKINIFLIISNNTYSNNIFTFLGVIKGLLDKLPQQIQSADTYRQIKYEISTIQNEINKFDLIYNKTLPIPDNYNQELISYLIKDIKRYLIDFDKDDILRIGFNDQDELNKFKTAKLLVDIRNILYRENQLLEDGIQVQKMISEIFSKISNIEDTRKLVDEVKEIAHDVKINISKNNNEKLVESFATEAKNISISLIKLNRYIILSFITIILILLSKSILIIYYQDSFKDIYNMIVFLSVILSISGLLTYLIKERKYYQKLHDFYNMRYLELNALPEYMQELTPEQRKNLIIQLAPTYFIGNNSTQPLMGGEIDSSGVEKKLDEITNIIKNIKELKN